MYEIEFYDTEDVTCPIQEFLDSLNSKLLAKTLRTIDLLEANGFVKKTQKTPSAEMVLAKKYKADYERRHENG